MNNDQIRATDGIDESYGTKSTSNGVSAGLLGMNSHSPLMTNGALVHRFIEEHEGGTHKRVLIFIRQPWAIRCKQGVTAD